MNTNPRAKVVVCYGDSNTWGDNPDSDVRYAPNIRWTGVLQEKLGDGYEVINEGLCGRTFEVFASDMEYRSGINHLKSILQTNKPTDIITVMLGTNDMKNTFNLSADDIAKHLENTIRFIQNEKTGINDTVPKIIIICPPLVAKPVNREIDERMVDAIDKSKLLVPLYRNVAKKLGCLFINAGDFINLENTDGYHLGKEHHKILGERIADLIQ